MTSTTSSIYSTTAERRDLVHISGSPYTKVCQFDLDLRGYIYVPPSGSWYEPANQMALEVRTCKQLDSHVEKISSMNIDFSFFHYETFFFLEDKAFEGKLTPSEEKAIAYTTKYMFHPGFRGYYLIRHENKGATDGYNLLSKYDVQSGSWITIKDGCNTKLSSDFVWNFFKKLLKTPISTKEKINSINLIQQRLADLKSEVSASMLKPNQWNLYKTLNNQ